MIHPQDQLIVDRMFRDGFELKIVKNGWQLIDPMGGKQTFSTFGLLKQANPCYWNDEHASR